MKNIKIYIILIIIFTFFISCESGLTIVSYNVGNFFDDVKDKTEYADFADWDKNNFEAKSKNLAYAISATSKRKLPGIILLQEIENENALSKLNEEIYLQSGKKYPYLAVNENTENLATVNGILSKYPFLLSRAHYIGRKYIQEVHIQYNKSNIIIFNVHLKSGMKERDKKNRKQAALFLNYFISGIHNDSSEIIIAGDFNSNFTSKSDIFSTEERSNEHQFKIELNPVNLDNNSFYTYCDSEHGTYYFNNHVECLDYFLISKSLLDNKFLSFKKMGVYFNDFLLSSNGKKPLSFNKINNKGYSDHLPIYLELEYKS